MVGEGLAVFKDLGTSAAASRTTVDFAACQPLFDDAGVLLPAVPAADRPQIGSCAVSLQLHVGCGYPGQHGQRQAELA